MTKNIKMFSVAVLIALVICFMPCISVFGFVVPDPDKPTSLSMTLKYSGDDVLYASGAEITLYKVADCKTTSSAVSYDLTSGYAASGLDLDGKITQSMIDDLVKYTDANSITGITKSTDNNGEVVFDGLESGVYLVSATSLPDGFSSFVPFLYYLPFFDQDTGAWVYDGVAEPKISYYPPVDITVKKVWNDDGKDRPASITVQLENEDGIVDTVVLNSANGWKHEWTNMRADKKWTVKETNVPKGYQVTYSSAGLDFTVTNTAKLIQTGQVQWPVPVMVFAGSFLICAGILIKLPGKKKDEE